MKTEHILIFIYLFLLVSCGSKDFSKDVIGKYSVEVPYSSSALSIDSAKQFIYEHKLSSCFGSQNVKIVTGDYIIKGNHLFLKPTKYSESYYEYEEIKNKKLIYDSLMPLSALKGFFDTLLIVRWNKNLYLFGANASCLKNPGKYFDSGLVTFMNYLNRSNFSFSNDSIISISKKFGNRLSWKRPCESCVETSFKNSLPEEWREYLLNNELKVKTLKIDTVHEEHGLVNSLVTLDGGQDKGIKLGQEFYSNAAPRVVSIIEVGEKFSKGICWCDRPEKCKVGVTLSSLIKK